MKQLHVMLQNKYSLMLSPCPKADTRITVDILGEPGPGGYSGILVMGGVPQGVLSYISDGKVRELPTSPQSSSCRAKRAAWERVV